MPKPLNDEALDVEFTDHAILTEALPVFEGVKVVYLGSNPKRALSMKGRINVTRAELPDDLVLVTKKPGRQNGRQYYDFTLRDDHGQLSPRRMSSTHPVIAVRDRPYADVEHPDHLYEFAKARGEFKLIGSEPALRAIEEYVRQRELMRAGAGRLRAEITGSQEQIVTAR